MSARERYERFLRDRHRPNHARRTAASHASFFTPFLRPGMRILDLGCGPGSITAGLGDGAIGVDLEPGPGGASADVYALPFADATFDAVFSCAVMQHLRDPLAALREARRVCRTGAVIGVADADWSGQVIVPDEALLRQGQDIQVALRRGASPFVGGRLRGLLHDAGFARVSVTARGAGGGDATSTPAQAAFQAEFFEAPETVAVVVAEGIASAREMADVASAWRRWGADPSAVSTGWWFEAIGWTD